MKSFGNTQAKEDTPRDMKKGKRGRRRNTSDTVHQHGFFSTSSSSSSSSASSRGPANDGGGRRINEEASSPSSSEEEESAEEVDMLLNRQKALESSKEREDFSNIQVQAFYRHNIMSQKLLLTVAKQDIMSKEENKKNAKEQRVEMKDDDHLAPAPGLREFLKLRPIHAGKKGGKGKKGGVGGFSGSSGGGSSFKGGSKKKGAGKHDNTGAADQGETGTGKGSSTWGKNADDDDEQSSYYVPGSSMLGSINNPGGAKGGGGAAKRKKKDRQKTGIVEAFAQMQDSEKIQFDTLDVQNTMFAGAGCSTSFLREKQREEDAENAMIYGNVDTVSTTGNNDGAPGGTAVNGFQLPGVADFCQKNHIISHTR